MTFEEKLRTDKFLITSEIGPPKGISLDKILQSIAALKGRVDAVNVTDLQSSVMRLNPLAASVILKENGFEPICQMTCRDRNRLALQADVLGLAALGVENILALTGDHPVLGDHPEAKSVFDIDSVQLIAAIRTLETGQDMAGNKLTGPPLRFCVGAVVNPGADPLEPEIIKMEKKLAAGAEFFQTQVVYDVKIFENFLAATRHLKADVLAGIVLLKSERMAQYMNENVPGAVVPDFVIEEMRRATDKRKTCFEITLRLVRELKSLCRGVHLMPLGWDDVVASILDDLGR